MSSEFLYYTWAVLLVLVCGAAWLSVIFSLPGNWGVVAAVSLFVFLLPVEEGRGITWGTVVVVAVLAAVGELMEFFAGVAGAARQGASRRAMLLAVVGTLVGSVAGAVLGVSIPIPLVGSVLGALVGGAAGAFAGAFVGETWKGRSSEESFAVGTGALVGRLLGTIGKLLIGAVMVVIVAIDAFR
jgi:hypothetical protein